LSRPGRPTQARVRWTPHYFRFCQSELHVIDHDESLASAVDAARVQQAFVPDEVRYEPHNAPPSAVLRELLQLGHKLVRGRAAIGDANEILIQGSVAWAYADRREFGLALAAKPASPLLLPSGIGKRFAP